VAALAEAFNPRIGRNTSVQAHRQGIVWLAKASCDAKTEVQRHSASAAVIVFNGTASNG